MHTEICERFQNRLVNTRYEENVLLYICKKMLARGVMGNGCATCDVQI